MSELNFLDLVILKKIDDDASVEKFGSLINTSFFETANLLGTIKIKGYIDIESSIGGISRVTLTEAGKEVLSNADKRATEPVDQLDSAILQALAAGTKELSAMQSSLNIRHSDLAFHLHKLLSQGFIGYIVRSATVSFMLTEHGFNAAGGARGQQKLESEAAPATLQGEEHPKPKGDGVAPPWVKPSEVEQEAQKHDVGQIMKEEHKGHKHEAHKTEHKHQMSPKELAAHERRKRIASKLQYYLTEYAPYIVMIIIISAIFIGAAILSLTKIS